MTPSTRPLWQRFLIFLAPLMLSNILQSLSGTINSVYIGQMLGVEALAATSSFFPIFFFLLAFMIGLGSGASILIGQAWGAKNIPMLKTVAGTTIGAAIILGIVVGLVGVTFTRPLMELLATPANVIDNATAYGRVMLAASPLLFTFILATMIMRGVGDTVTPLICLVLQIMIGLVVTPALIQGWFGLPQLGILSAAVAFLVGNIVLVFLFFYMRIRKHPLAPDAELLSHLWPKRTILWQILRLGLPAGVQMVVASLAAIVVVGIVNRFGSNATAAYGAVGQVLSYVQFPAISISIASSIFAAQAIGARQMAQVENITRTGLWMNVWITGGLVLLAYIFSESIVRLFITSEDVVAITETLLHIVLWSVVLMGFGAVLSAVMRASGDVLVPMLLSLATIICVEVPGALILSRYLGLNGVWVAYTLSFSTALVLQGAYFWFVWRRKEIRALV